MARPIKDTPILFGEDARRFETRMSEQRKISPQKKAQMKRDYETVKQWFNNGYKFDEQRQSTVSHTSL